MAVTNDVSVLHISSKDTSKRETCGSTEKKAACIRQERPSQKMLSPEVKTAIEDLHKKSHIIYDAYHTMLEEAPVEHIRGLLNGMEEQEVKRIESIITHGNQDQKDILDKCFSVESDINLGDDKYDKKDLIYGLYISKKAFEYALLRLNDMDSFKKIANDKESIESGKMSAIIDSLKVSPQRKKQIKEALLYFAKNYDYSSGGQTSHFNPNFSGVDDIDTQKRWSTSFNYNMGGSDGPVLYALPDMVKLNDDPNIVYATTYTQNDVPHSYIPSAYMLEGFSCDESERNGPPMDDALVQDIAGTTPQDVQNRTGIWPKETWQISLHKQFMFLTSFNIDGLMQDLYFKKGKEDSEKLSVEDLKSVKLLSP